MLGTGSCAPQTPHMTIQPLLDFSGCPQLRRFELKRHCKAGVRAMADKHHDNLGTGILNTFTAPAKAFISYINGFVQSDPIVHRGLRLTRYSSIEVLHRHVGECELTEVALQNVKYHGRKLSWADTGTTAE